MENLVLIRTLEELQDLANKINALDPAEVFIALDSETSGLTKGSAVIGYSFSWEENTGYYVVLGAWSTELNTLVFNADLVEPTKSLFTDLLRYRLIMHNSTFDCDMLRRGFQRDLMPALFADTLELAHLLDENNSAGLKAIAARLFGEASTKEQQEMKASVLANGGVWSDAKGGNKEMYKADSELLGRYGAKDTILTLKIFYALIPQLFEEGLDRFFFEEESMPLMRTATYDMNSIGLRVDMNKLKDLERELEEEIGRLRAEVTEAIAPLVKDRYPGTKKTDTFNIGSGTQLSWLFFIKLGCEFKQLTDAGRLISHQLLGKLPYKLSDKRQFINLIQSERARVDAELARLVIPKANKKNPPEVAQEIINKKSAKKTLAAQRSKWVPEKYLKCDKEVLPEIAKRYPWVTKLLKLRAAEKLLGTYVQGIQARVNYGILNPSFLQHGTTSGRYSSSGPNCLSMDTQVLTTEGFKFYEELGAEAQVAVYDSATNTTRFEQPRLRYKSEMAWRGMTTIENQHCKFYGTADHRFLLAGRNTGQLCVVPASEVKADRKLLHGAPMLTGQLALPLAQLRFLVACQADAELRTDAEAIRFVFHKERKAKRLQEILAELPYRVETGRKGKRHEIRVYGASEMVKTHIGQTKLFPWAWLSLTPDCRATLLEEIMHWDGCFTRKQNYSSSNAQNVEVVQALYALSGVRAHKRIYLSKTGRPNYQLDVSFKPHSFTTNAKVTTRLAFTQVWCLEVSTGFFITRRGSDTLVTGNCQNIPRDDTRVKACIVSRPGKVFVGADYSQLEPRVFASVSQDPDLLNCFAEGKDFYSVVGIPVYKRFDSSPFKDDKNAFAVVYKKERQMAKALALASAYGTTAAQQARKLFDDAGHNLSIKDAQNIIDAYFENFPAVKQMMETQHDRVMRDGVVHSLYGRPRRVPEAKRIRKIYGQDIKHADLPYEWRGFLNLGVNHSIQSSGATIVNRAAVAFSVKMKELGIEANIVLQVHDELVAECWEKDSEVVAKELQHAMQFTTVLPGVELIAEPKVAKNLADLK